MGLPPSGGFAAKWMLAQASIAAGQGWWAVVLLAGGLLAAAYVFAVLGRAMDRSEPPGEPAHAVVPRGQQAIPLAFALVSVGMGAAAAPIAGLLAGLAAP
jgi:formate hydrogenlyase subunit 3/multisubunit Na+/H+ antiporter MnhD subunit